MAETKEDFVTALETDAVIERFRLILDPIFSGILEPYTRKLGDAITKREQYSGSTPERIGWKGQRDHYSLKTSQIAWNQDGWLRATRLCLNP